MSLRKEIEKTLAFEDNEVDAVEDDLMKESVLAIASSDFKEQDVIDVSLSNRKRPIVDLDVEYPGKPVSRKKYRRDVDLNYDIAVSESDIDKSDDDQSEISSFEEDSDDDDVEGLGEENDDDEESSGSEVDEDETDSGADQVSHGSDSPKMDKDNDSSVKLFSSKQHSSTDIQKGLAIKEQLRIWESLLECRIKLEPSLVAANQLYQLEKMSEFISNEKSTDASSVDSALNAIHELSLAWSKLQMLLGGAGNNKLNDERKGENGESDGESIRSSEASGASDDEDTKSEQEETTEVKTEDDNNSSHHPTKTSSKLKSLKQSYSEFGVYRDSELEKWNEKAKISSGKTAQRDFSAFDQSILKVIESILYDKHRLIKKTQLKRNDYVIHGKSNALENIKLDDNVEIEAQTLKNDRRNEPIYDPEIFDDGDFYHKLLRDFIESKSSDGKNERKLVELHKLRIKMKRKVDTKATKGRKLRFAVHQKLVNFMAPVPSNNFSEEAETQLLRSLFGQAISRSVPETAIAS